MFGGIRPPPPPPPQREHATRFGVSFVAQSSPKELAIRSCSGVRTGAMEEMEIASDCFSAGKAGYRLTGKDNTQDE